MRIIHVVLFEDFELLDVFGPVELFINVNRLKGPERYEIEYWNLNAADKKTARSSGGPDVVCERTLTPEAFRMFVESSPENATHDLLIPGGAGTRVSVQNAQHLSIVRRVCSNASVRRIVTVCTGSALLAKTGMLDGKAATSNKNSFAWCVAQGPRVDWRPHARWVVSENFFTSSGVAAGCDLAVELISRDFGEEVAAAAARRIEYAANRSPHDDVFKPRL